MALTEADVQACLKTLSSIPTPAAISSTGKAVKKVAVTRRRCRHRAGARLSGEEPARSR